MQHFNLKATTLTDSAVVLTRSARCLGDEAARTRQTLSVGVVVFVETDDALDANNECLCLSVHSGSRRTHLCQNQTYPNNHEMYQHVSIPYK